MIVNCSICVDDVCDTKVFTCKNKECNLAACIKCHQKYLMDSINQPHCMGCHHEISLDDFVKFFPKNWRLNQYKEHIKNILWSKEQTKMNETLARIERDVQVQEQRKLINFYNNKINECNLNIYYLNHPEIIRQVEGGVVIEGGGVTQEKKQKVNVYKYKCPSEECNGSLNSKYECLICGINYCKDCFEIINDENKDDHKCDDEKKKTITQIKKEAKPCPTCGEMISKVSGCQQMFCITCGTGFNWVTGEVEKGVIHNPHAARYFQDNPEARERYNANGGRQVYNNVQNVCNFTQFTLADHIRKYKVPDYIYDQFLMCWRNTYNFDNYNYQRIDISEPNNNDYRMKWLKNEIDETNFKKITHMRHKKYQKNKMDNEIITMAKTILTDMMRDILNCRSSTSIINLLNNDMQKFADYSNNELIVVGEYFGLKPRNVSVTFNIN